MVVYWVGVGQRGLGFANTEGGRWEGEVEGGFVVLGVGLDLAEANEEGGHLGLGTEDQEEIVHEDATAELIGVEWTVCDLGLFEELAPKQIDDAVAGGAFEVVGGLEDEAIVEGLDDVADRLLVLFGEVLEEGVILEPRWQEVGGLVAGVELGHGEAPGRGGGRQCNRVYSIYKCIYFSREESATWEVFLGNSPGGGRGRRSGCRRRSGGIRRRPCGWRRSRFISFPDSFFEHCQQVDNGIRWSSLAFDHGRRSRTLRGERIWSELREFRPFMFCRFCDPVAGRRRLPKGVDHGQNHASRSRCEEFGDRLLPKI